MRSVRHSSVWIAFVVGSAVAVSADLSIAAPSLPITTPAVIVPPGPAGASPVSVLIAPFRPIGETTKDAWISEAIDEQMSSDLSRNPAVHVLHSPTTMPVADSLSLARQQHADRLVTGSFQTIDDQIRVNGDVVDPSDGKTVAQLKVTGAKRDLFRLEDALVAELEHVLPGVQQPDNSYTVTPVATDGLNQPTEANAQSDSGSMPQVVNNYYYDNGSGYGNSGGNGGDYLGGYGGGYGGYGDFGYPYYGSPFFLYLGGDRFHHFHDGYGSGGHNRQVGGGPILLGPNRGFGPSVTGPSHGFGGGHGPVGGGAMGGGGAHGVGGGGAMGGGAAGGHR